MAEIYCIVKETVKLHDTARKKDLHEPLAYDNSKAHSVRAIVVNDDGTEADLSGITAIGSMMRADGYTVTPINGSIDGNVAEIILPGSCYIAPGRFKLTLNLFKRTSTSGVSAFNTTTAYSSNDLVVYDGVVWRFTQAHAAGAWTGTDAVQDGAQRTILWVNGTVERNISTLVVDPGTPVGNITQAIADATDAASAASTAAAAANAAADDAEAYADSVAPDYEEVSFPIAAYSQLCWHEGSLYVNNQTISTSEDWTAAHWTQTSISTELARYVKFSSDFATVAETKSYLGIT